MELYFEQEEKGNVGSSRLRYEEKCEEGVERA